MQFGFILICAVLATLSYTLGTMQTAAFYQERIRRSRPRPEPVQLRLPLLDHPASSV